MMVAMLLLRLTLLLLGMVIAIIRVIGETVTGHHSLCNRAGSYSH